MKILISLTLLFYSGLLFSNNIYDKKHQIDIWQEKTLKKSQTTMEILAVYGESYKKWDKELN